jgi:outer membrane receptor protein involved in Fe transport
MKASLLGALSAGAAPFAFGVAALSAPALADEAAGSGQGTQIIVTGTLLASGNVKSVAPITTLTSQDIALSGSARMEDILNALPQVSPGQTSAISAGASGTATVDLRGLGPNRTLVLIDGRRLSPGDPGSSVADLNFVPAALVKRVDVLTGGASATYGADAVAGVVNFVMDTDFTGFRISATNGFYAHDNANGTMQPVLAASGQSYPIGNTDDGRSIDTTVSFGTRFADGRSHVMAYLGYRTANPVAQSARDYSSCTLQNATSPSPSAPLQCGGSLYSANGNALFFIPGTPMVGTFGPGTLTPGALTSFNTAPQNYFQRPDERYTSGLFADYEISPAAHPYVEFMFMDDRTTAQLAPSGDFGDTLTINCDNPMLSGQQHGMLCGAANKVVGYLGTFPLVSMEYAGLPASAQSSVTGLTTAAASNTAFLELLRRNVEGGPRTNQLTHTSFRTVAGSRGVLGHGWAYDAYFQYGRTDLTEI